MSLNSSIADLILEKGRAQAAGVAGAGQAWGQGLANIGQTVGQAVAAIPQLQEQQRAKDARKALSDAMNPQNVPRISQDGLQLLDVPGMANYMSSKGFAPEFIPAADHLDTINKSTMQFQQSRVQLVKANATALLAAGGDPSLAVDALQHMKGNQVYSDNTLDGWIDRIKNHPEDTPKILQSIAGPQKMETAAPGSSARNAVTGEIVPNSTAPPLPGTGQHIVNGQLLDDKGQPIGAQVPKESDPVAVAAQAETARHNIVMEAIGKLNTGREAAAQAETARHNKAMELAANPFGSVTAGTLPAGQQPGQSGQGGATGPTGEDVLKGLPAGTANEIRLYASGKLPFPTGMSVSKLQPLIQAVTQYDPTFDASNFNARNKARSDLTSPSGTGGKTINALNTAIQHAGKLSDLIETLDNYESPIANAVVNPARTLMGKTEVTNFNAVAPQLAKEIERAWRGTGGSTADVKELIDSIGKNMGRQQQREALAQFVELAQGKLNTTETQRDNALGPIASKDVPVLYEQNKPLIAKIQQRASGDTSAPKAPAVGDKRTYNGETRTWDGTQWVK